MSTKRLLLRRKNYKTLVSEPSRPEIKKLLFPNSRLQIYPIADLPPNFDNGPLAITSISSA